MAERFQAVGEWRNPWRALAREAKNCGVDHQGLVRVRVEAPAGTNRRSCEGAGVVRAPTASNTRANSALEATGRTMIAARRRSRVHDATPLRRPPTS
jgi:hypothetical protein